MKKLDFFLAAMAAGEQRRRAWVITAFSLIREGVDDWKKNPYPYRIVQTPAGHFFVNPQNTQELLPIEGCEPGQPPFHNKERVVVTKERVPNLPGDSVEASLETNYGNLLFNFVALIWPFGRKLPYMQGRVSAQGVEELILERLEDDPDPTAPVPKTMQEMAPIYVSEYLKFANAMFYLAGFTQLWVPAATAKTMTAAPGIKELRDKLLKQNKDRLHDPAVVAQIQAQLVQYDREYLKGDPGENFLISNKSFQVVRSKQYGMHGAEMNTLTDSVDVSVIPTSLSEGWSIDHFADYMNSLRGGTFGRSAQTQLGGESVKWLLRASSNITVTEEDCRSALGTQILVSEANHAKLVGFSVVDERNAGASQRVTKQDSGTYIGKRLMMRSPMYCKLPKTDYCRVCVGERLAINPTALSAAISEYGSAFLGIFMSAVHGKALTVAKMDYQNAIT